MILADSAILNQIEQGNILIRPFDPKALGSNSYDVHLSPHLKVYRDLCTVHDNEASLFKATHPDLNKVLDAKEVNKTLDLIIPAEGIVLKPGILYLASTVEYTDTKKLVPYLEGKSSMGRLGIKVHVTAGKGDIGFHGHWTLEIEVTHPVRVYAGMAVAQLSYFRVDGFCINPYNKKVDAKYNNNNDSPVASRNEQNFKSLDSNQAFRDRMGDSGIAGIPDEE